LKEIQITKIVKDNRNQFFPYVILVNNIFHSSYMKKSNAKEVKRDLEKEYKENNNGKI